MKIIKKIFYYLYVLKSIILNVKKVSYKDKLFLVKSTTTSFYLRNFMDLWMLTETYFNHDYEKYGCQIKRNWTILDIGAAFGDFSIFAAKKSLENRVIAIEPLPNSQRLLDKNIKINNVKNIEIYRGAISSTATKLSIFEDQKNFGHSRVSPDSFCNVKAISLEKLFTNYKIAHCDLIKCDCEGSEYDIFLSLDPKIFKKIDNIIMEYHLFSLDHIKDFKKLKVLLFESGYTLKLNSNPVHSNLGFLFASRKN